MKPLKKPEGKKNLDFHNAQAAARKYVERAFGILQAQFAIVRGLARFWDQKMLWYMIEAEVSRSFDEMITIDLVKMTLTIRLQTCMSCALAIAKPTPRGY